MKIKLTRGVIVNGKPMPAGAVVTLPDREALGYVQRRQAVPAQSKREKATAPKGEKRSKK